MAFRRDDDLNPRTSERAAFWYIVSKDTGLPARLRQRLHKRMHRSPEILIHLLVIVAVNRALARQKLADCFAKLDRVIAASRGLHAENAATEAHVLRRSPLVTRRAAIALGLATVTAVGVGYSIYDPAPVREVSAKDGSTLYIRRGSRYRIDFNDQHRLVHLRHGAIIFEVAKDPKRPFIVRTASNDIVAIGTRFSVVVNAAGTTTTVSEGTVRVVAPSGVDQTTGTLLTADQELRVVRGALHPEPIATVDGKQKLCWTKGWLLYRGEPVREAVKDFNRLNETQIELMQAELGDTPLGYYNFVVDQPKDFAHTLAAELNWSVTWDARRKVIQIGNKPE